MATKKLKGLGLGLEALLGPTVNDGRSAGAGRSDVADGPNELPLDALQPGRYQPRTQMDDAALLELADSIKAQGVIQPVLVRPIEDVDGMKRYEIIAGERRCRAARLAGLERIPALVRDVPDEAAAAMALIENMQREDLNPLEEARGLRRLIDEFGMTHEAVAKAVGRSRSAASNLLRLLQLSAPVQSLLLAGSIEMGHARALLPLDGARQILSANAIVAKKLSVRDTERLVARQAESAGRQPVPPGGKPQKGRDILRLEQQLSDRFAAAVEIRMRGASKAASNRGEIAIAFASLDELNGLLSRLGHDSA